MEFEGKIKGVHLLNVIDYVKHKKGIQGLNEFFQIVNDGRSYHDIIKEDSLIPKNWYPYETYLIFLRTADLITGNGEILVLAGGRPRGAIYAVYEYLHRVGVRWYSPEYTKIPKNQKVEFKEELYRYVDLE